MYLKGTQVNHRSLYTWNFLNHADSFLVKLNIVWLNLWLKDAERVHTSSCEAPEARTLWTDSKQDVLFVQETKVEIPETPPAAGKEQTNQHTVCSLCVFTWIHFLLMRIWLFFNFWWSVKIQKNVLFINIIIILFLATQRSICLISAAIKLWSSSVWIEFVFRVQPLQPTWRKLSHQLMSKLFFGSTLKCYSTVNRIKIIILLFRKCFFFNWYHFFFMIFF